MAVVNYLTKIFHGFDKQKMWRIISVNLVKNSLACEKCEGKIHIKNGDSIYESSFVKYFNDKAVQSTHFPHQSLLNYNCTHTVFPDDGSDYKYSSSFQMNFILCLISSLINIIYITPCLSFNLKTGNNQQNNNQYRIVNPGFRLQNYIYQILLNNNL